MLRKELMKAHDTYGNWRLVASLPEYLGVPAGTLCSIAARGYEPKNAHIRSLLHLPVLDYAPVCPRCGIVHVAKKCPGVKRLPRDLFEMEPSLLAWKLENRENAK